MVRRTNEKRRCIRASATTELVCKKARPEAAAATPVTVELWKTAPITGARARLISEKAIPPRIVETVAVAAASSSLSRR